MFDIGFFELLLIFIVGLVVLGPQRLPVAIRTVMGWIHTIRGLAANVQNELSQELKLQELQESIKKAEHLNLQQLSPELGKTVEELKTSAQKLKTDLEQKASQKNTTFEQEVQALKSAVQNEHEMTDADHADKQSVDSQSAHSPAEQAELAEQDEPMLHIPAEYYSADDSLADVESADDKSQKV